MEPRYDFLKIHTLHANNRGLKGHNHEQFSTSPRLKQWHSKVYVFRSHLGVYSKEL